MREKKILFSFASLLDASRESSFHNTLEFFYQNALKSTKKIEFPFRRNWVTEKVCFEEILMLSLFRD